MATPGKRYYPNGARERARRIRQWAAHSQFTCHTTPSWGWKHEVFKPVQPKHIFGTPKALVRNLPEG